jgi:hypothetical protein
MAAYRLTLLLVFIISYAAAQENQYFVFFKDKTGTPFSISSPSQFLSERSIARRQKQGIAISEEDLPVNPAYVSQVSGAGATVYFSSRWWNGVLIETTGSALANINALPFVSHYTLVAPGKKLTGGRIRNNKHRKSSAADEPANQNQLEQIGLDYMHALGYEGQGILIAIFDSGFTGVNVTEPFSHLFSEGRMKQTYNFVNNSTDVYQNHSHGTEVLSVMAAYTSGVYVGGAHNAEFLLYLTEDVSSEYRVEEFNWTIAAERADSAGVDVINSSLGYYDFDDPAMNYTKADLDGKKAIITQAARKAIDKGIVVVTSAGNEGGNSWKLVTPPADADGILATGSINSLGDLSGFSSVGPTSDNRIKPDVVALGAGTSVIKSNGTVGSSSGTSLASPLIASLAAGVLQAFPMLGAEEIYEAIVSSADQASRPDNQKGYGLPNFLAVKNYIEGKQSDEIVSVYPNPVSGNTILIKLKDLTDAPVQIVIFDSMGKRAEEYSHTITWLNNPLEYDLTNLQAGIYLIRITAGMQTATLKFVKL